MRKRFQDSNNLAEKGKIFGRNVFQLWSCALLNIKDIQEQSLWLTLLAKYCEKESEKVTPVQKAIITQHGLIMAMGRYFLPVPYTRQSAHNVHIAYPHRVNM